MLSLAIYVTLILLVILIPVVAVAKYLEWRAWDTDRRIERLRARRLRAAAESLTYRRRYTKSVSAMSVSADKAAEAFRQFGRAFTKAKP